MDIYVGYGRYNEYYQSTGGVVGDQLQKSNLDTTGEVSLSKIEDFLKESPELKATVYRIADATLTAKIGEGIVKCCENPYIGYDESNRLSILKYGIHSGQYGKGAECDDTSLARVVLKYGTDIDLGDFNRNSVRRILGESKLFLDAFDCNVDSELYIGDVLVCNVSNRVGIVGKGLDRPIPKPSGEGGTDDYNELENKPSINGKQLSGNSTLSELGIVTPKVVNGTIIFS